VSEISWKRIRELSASFCGGRPAANRNWPDDGDVAVVVDGGGWPTDVEDQPRLDELAD
jgi:hypothetical protein